MRPNQKKQFLSVVKHVSDNLGWQIRALCSECKSPLMLDVFVMQKAYGRISTWWCEQCALKKETGEIVPLTHGTWNTEGGFVPDIRKDLKEYQKLFLDAYLQGSYFFETESSSASRDYAFLGDLTHGHFLLVTSLELFVSEWSNHFLRFKGLEKEMIGCLLKKYHLFNYLELIQNAGIGKEMDQHCKNLMKVNDLRNKVVHSGTKVSPEEYIKHFECVGVAMASLEKTICR